MGVLRTVLRVTIGGLFVGHGTQKLAGWFGGKGLDGTAASFAKLGLEPARENAVLAGISETAGGTLLTLGVATPLAASALLGTLLTAVKRVHGANGVWMTKDGFEYHLVLGAALLGLVEAGPGPLSLDRLRGHDRWGLAWAGLALSTALTGAALLDARARRAAVGSRALRSVPQSQAAA